MCTDVLYVDCYIENMENWNDKALKECYYVDNSSFIVEQEQ